MKNLFLLIIGLMSVFFLAAQSPGTLDLSFGNNGIVLTDVGEYDDGCRAAAVQADGKIVLGGYYYDGSNNIFAFVRYLPDGSLDNAFGTSGIVTIVIGKSGDELFDIAIQGDGKILAVGYTFSDALGKATMAAMRLNTDGTLDNNFGEQGIAIIDFGFEISSYAMAVALQDDGKIVVAGYNVYDSSNEVNCAYCRLNPDGTLDSSFGINGILDWSILSMDNYINNVAMQGDKIILGGVSFDDLGVAHLTIGRKNPDGYNDNSFADNGLITMELDLGYVDEMPLGSMCLDDQQRIIYGCYTKGVDSDDFATYRFVPDGLADISYGNSGVAITQTEGHTLIHAILAQYDEKIIAGGHQWIEDHGDFAMTRYMEDGNPDISFGSEGTGVVITNASPLIDEDNRIYSLAMQADGMIIAAGHAFQSGSGTDFAIARYYSGLNIGIESPEADKINLSITPNPVTDHAIIGFTLDEAVAMKVEVINSSGKIVDNITDKLYTVGTHQLRWNADGLPVGIYIIKMAVGSKTYSTKLIKSL